jgi:putative tricarboxylic transport membrane protein
LFLFAFMIIRARVGTVFATLYTVSGIVFICAMAWLLHRDFPPGLLQEYFTLPWPFT